MPQLVNTPLWTHQREAIEKFRYEERILCGWDMGTGKTLFAIERDLQLRADTGHKYPTLVIAPLNTHDQWKEAWELEAPHLKVKVIDPKNRHLFLKGELCSVYIIHWQALRLMEIEFRTHFAHAILDEVHYIKNRKAAVTKAAKAIKVDFVTDMSGSPATDRPGDLWSILNHVQPKIWTGYHKFIDMYVEQEDVYVAGQKRFKKLGGPTDEWVSQGLASLHQYYSRVEIDDVLDMPERLYTKTYVDLTPPQRRAYDEMDKEMIAWINDQGGDLMPMVAPALISKLIRLQQFALAQMEWNSETEKYRMALPSPKLEAALELMDNAGKQPFLVWSQFKAPLVLLQRLMNTRSAAKGGPITNVLYTGDQSKKERAENKAKFVAGDARVFMATIKAAGTGTDGLQHNCRQMIFLDRDWSPMANKQAESRLWRGGQNNTVIVHDIMARDTVDFPRGARIELKKEWVMKTLGGRHG